MLYRRKYKRIKVKTIKQLIINKKGRVICVARHTQKKKSELQGFAVMLPTLHSRRNQYLSTQLCDFAQFPLLN